MICANCGEDSAQLFKRTVDGKELSLVLCPVCYKKLYPEGDAADMFTHFLGNTGARRSKACPSCGTTLGEYRKTGLLGCADCYTAFREELLSSIRFIQRDVVHRGKQPDDLAGSKYDEARELILEQESVRAEIDRALLSGDYKKAEALRLRLKEIDDKLSNMGRG